MKRRMYVHLVFTICLAMLFWAGSAYAGEPTELVKQTTGKVIGILKNSELRKPERTKERRAEIRKVVSERFDFEEMAKRSLARYWNERTAEELKEFVSLYTDLLERTYIRKIESYTDEKFIYGEESNDGEYAVVRTRIETKKRSTEVPLDYKLMKKNGKWVVYDVIIEGVSLVNNYRNQFNRIMTSGSYQELIKRMRSKQVKGAAEDSGSPESR